MIRILIACVLFLVRSAVAGHCQDLVPNGDFKRINICEQFYQCAPSAWFNSHKFGGPGYVHPPSKDAGGREFLNLVAVSRRERRDYWETMLLCPLEPGRLYHVSLRISADALTPKKISTDGIEPNLNDIGFYFTDHFIFSRQDTVFHPDSGVLEFTDAKARRQSGNWYSIQKDFRPTTATQFLIIGNFSPETNSEILAERRSEYGLVQLSVDDVSIVAQGGIPCKCMAKVRDSLYAIRARHPKDRDSQGVTPAILKADSRGYTADSAAKKAGTSANALTGKPDTIRLSNVLFEFGRSELRDPTFLEQYRSVLSDTTVKRLVIAGYADDAGPREYNLQLSTDRARTVAASISKICGVPASLIEIKGKGISSEYADRSLNRRVEIYIYH